MTVILVLGLVLFSGVLSAQSDQTQADSLRAKMNQAISLMKQGKLDEGVTIARYCIPKAQEAGLHAVEGSAYYLLAGAFFNMRDMEKANAYARTAFQAYQKAGDRRGMGNAYKIVGVMMLANQQLDSAFFYAQESARCFEDVGDTGELALAYTRMGHVYNLKKEYKKATPYYLRSYDISRSDTFSVGFMNANLSLACNYLDREQLDAALPYALKAREIAQKLNSFYEKNTALEYLSHIYEKKGQFAKALEYERQFRAANDSVFNTERLRQVRELEIKYETAEKQAAIKLLEKDKANQQTLLMAGLFTLLILAGGIILIVRFFRQRNKALALAQQQTAQLLQAEHREAGRLAELDAFKSRFFTNISHEFRTPLTVILGMAEQLRRHFGQKENKKPAEMQADVVRAATFIQRNGEHLLRLINQILDLAKLETNTLRLNYVQGDVAAYLPYLAESLRSLADERGVALRIETSPAPVIMDYDPERLRQVVHNLLSNAIKFTPGGGQVALSVACEERKDLAGFENLPRLKITVADTGTGIAPEDLPQIFDRFYQAPNAQKVAASGSGIGLSLTRELLHAMGGDIQAASEVGKGSTFTVSLPIRRETKNLADQLPVQAFPEKTAAVAHADPDPVSAETPEDLPVLLLVEDNPDVAEYLRACLSDQYQLAVAVNGREGIEKALETVPDLILSDVMMPEKDGLQLCDALKNDERTSHIPIVLLTARADVESRLAGLQRGADAYLAKPFYPDELTLVLKNLLTLRQRWQRHFAPSAEGLDALVVPDMATQDFTPENTFLNKVKEKIAQHCDDHQFDGPRLARAMLLSEVQLYRKIKALTGKSTALYIRSLRLQKGMELLRSTTLTISEIAYDVGFEDPNYFSRTFTQEFGMAPSEFRK